MSKRNRRRQRRNIGAFAAWIVAGLVVVAVAAVVAVVVASGGSDDGGDAQAAATPRPDPRVAGATPAATVAVEADDDGQNVNPRFVPNVLEGPAGAVLAIDIKNVGTVAHNLRVSGADKQYDTTDDFASVTVLPGKTALLPVRIDTAGSYPFRCDFHPQQTGTLVLN